MSALLDALDYATGVLDKPGRAARGLLAGNAREGLAALPFSDALGWTDPAERVSGEDLLRGAGLDTGNGTADWLLGQGAEILLDPTNLIGAGAAAKGLKSLRGLGRSGETIDGAIDALKFAREPGVESYARAPAGVIDRTRGLGPVGDDLPLASQVGTPFGSPGYGDEWEFALRSNRAAREGAGRFGPVPAGTLDDLPKFDDLPGGAAGAAADLGPPPVAPDFADWSWRLGDPYHPEASSVLTDAAQEGMSAADLHRLAMSQWDDALKAVAADPTMALEDPRWRSALLGRLAEVYGATRYGSVLPVPDDVAAGLLGQYARLHDLLGTRPVRVGGLVALAHAPGGPAAPGLAERLSQLANLRDLSGANFAVADIAPGKMMDRKMRFYADRLPLLSPDMDAARRIAGRQEAADAADYVRELATELNAGTLEPADFEGAATNLLNGGRGQIPHGQPTLTPDAVRGALRTNPGLRGEYDALLEALRRRQPRPVAAELDDFADDLARDLDPNAFY